MHSSRFEAIGTVWQIDIYDSITVAKAQNLFRIIKKRISNFDHTYSRFRQDSLVTEMSVKKGIYSLPFDAAPLVSLYEELYYLTAGKFTPLIGQTLVDAGYDASYSLKPKALHTPPSWNETMEYTPPSLKIKRPALLDFGAAGKGYIVDIVAALCKDAKIQTYCIDAGGDMFYQDLIKSKELKVGLEDPTDTKRVIGVIPILNQSICASAGNRRNWGKYNHIIDPETLKSPEHILSTWVVADSAILADAITTCLFFITPQALLKRYNYEYLIMYRNRTILKSSGFKADLFTQK